jgi:hypothetical protein
MSTTYMIAASGADKNGNREIVRFTDEEDRTVFAVVPATAAADMLEAIRRAYRDGRGDSPEIAVSADAAVPDGEDPLNWLKMCIQGYDYLLALPEPGLATWNEACDRGRRRIIAACLALIRQEQEAQP